MASELYGRIALGRNVNAQVGEEISSSFIKADYVASERLTIIWAG